MHSTKEDYIHEYCRYGKSELHSVSSFIGMILQFTYPLIITFITHLYQTNYYSIFIHSKIFIHLFSGGCVSHEIIKIITQQYKPVNNSFVFNAINCSTESFTL